MTLLLGLAACGGTKTPVRLDINSEVPKPVIAQLPVTAGIVFAEELTRYQTIEEQQNGKRWQIDLGSANKTVLSEIFGTLFTTLVEKPDVATAAQAEPDFILVPSIDDYSMLSASDSGSKFYAVSMRHFIDVYDAAGKRAARVEVNSYGRERRGGVMSNGMSEIDAATDDAFRDLAVTLITQLPDQLMKAGLINDHTALTDTTEPDSTAPQNTENDQ